MPFNLGFGEILLVLLVILLLFGAKRIPEIAGSFGKGIRELKKSMTEVERQIIEPEPPARSDRLPPADATRREGLPRQEPAPARAEDDAGREPKRLLG
jgi:sec-independent protein translocase protein TatA